MNQLRGVVHLRESTALPILDRVVAVCRNRHAGSVLLLALLPFMLLYINDSWTYLAPSRLAIDPYVYTGYFLDLQGYLDNFGPLYYSSRLPWLLLGAGVHAVAAPAEANLLLRFLLFYSGIFSLYVFVYTTWRDTLAATLAALMLATHTYFLSAIGWDYVDGPGLVTVLAAFACFAVAVESTRWRFWLVAGGACVCVAVCINVFLLVLAPLSFVWYAALNHRGGQQRLKQAAAFVSSGAVAVFGALAMVNFRLTGSFDFFSPQLRAATGIDDTPWQVSIGTWIHTAGWLAFPAVAAGLACGVLAWAATRRRALTDAEYRCVLAGGVLLAAVAMFAVLQFSTYMTVLQYPSYASYLVPFSFIVFGAAISLLLNLVKLSLPVRRVLPLAALAVLLAPYATSLLRVVPACPEPCLSTGRNDVLLLALGVLMVGAIALRNGRVALACLVLVSTANVVFADSQALTFSSDRSARDQALLVYDVTEALRPLNRDAELRFWYDISEPLGPLFRGVAATNLFDYRLIGENFPEIPDAGSTPSLIGVPVVYMTQQRAPLDRLQSTFATDREQPEVLFERRMQRGRQSVGVVVFRTRPSGEGEPLLLSGFRQSGGRLESVERGMRVKTLDQQWAYAAALDLSNLRYDPDLPAQFSVRLKVEGGSVGVGVLNRDGSDFLARKPVPPSQTPVDVYLAVPRLADASQLIVQTWDRGAGVATVLEVRIYPSGEPQVSR